MIIKKSSIRFLILARALLIIFLLAIAAYLCADEVVIPTLPKDLMMATPLDADLLVNEYNNHVSAEQKATENIMQTVVTGSKKQLEAKANELARNQKKLGQFLSALPAQIAKVQQEKEQQIAPTQKTLKQMVDVTEETVHILEAQLQHEKLDAQVSLSLRNATLADVIELINKSIGLNFIVDPSLNSSACSLQVRDAKCATVLKTVLNMLRPRAALLEQEGVFHIVPYEKAATLVKKQAQALRKKNFEAAYITLYHADIDDGFKKRLDHLWHQVIQAHTDYSGYYMICDDAAKKVFVRARSDDVATITKFLHALDVPKPQIKIEARVVVASRNFEDSWGLNWSSLYNRRESICNGFEFVGTGPLQDIRNNPEPQTKCELMDWALNLFPFAGLCNRTVNIPFVFGGNDLNTKRLNIVLNAAENRGDIQTILKPSLLTSNNEEAEILVGSRVPIETVIRETIEGSLRDITTATYIDVGTKLRVKPSVAPDNSFIFLDMYVENSCVEGTSGKFPVIRTSRSHNRVILKSTQTTLISGLIENIRNQEKNAIPLLGDVPLFGWLFKGIRKFRKDCQLLIFLTPTIV